MVCHVWRNVRGRKFPSRRRFWQDNYMLRDFDTPMDSSDQVGGGKHIIDDGKETFFPRSAINNRPPTTYEHADWTDCNVTRCSKSGTYVTISGAPVSSSSKRQTMMVLSSSEAEYIASSSCEKSVAFMPIFKRIINQRSNQRRILGTNNLKYGQYFRNPIVSKV